MHTVLRVEELVCPAAGDAPLHEAPRVVLAAVVLADLGEGLKLVVVLRRCNIEVLVGPGLLGDIDYTPCSLPPTAYLHFRDFADCGQVQRVLEFSLGDTGVSPWSITFIHLPRQERDS